MKTTIVFMVAAAIVGGVSFCVGYCVGFDAWARSRYREVKR